MTVNTDSGIRGFGIHDNDNTRLSVYYNVLHPRRMVLLDMMESGIHHTFVNGKYKHSMHSKFVENNFTETSVECDAQAAAALAAKNLTTFIERKNKKLFRNRKDQDDLKVAKKFLKSLTNS